ncbi:hypothetical protein BDV93DRAFT_563556 [Ceratobasidium sp. AG-I]|nr:hypothetical protein BDV93DRAFT_563556 [Ceratobasidium sp. AG-I]
MSSELSPPLCVSDRLKQLRQLLSQLPGFVPISDGSRYPFQNFQVDSEWVETTGSAQGSLNHTLEVVFGSRAARVAAGLTPVAFESCGPDLEAVVDVLSDYIIGDAAENAILLNWVDDLTKSVKSIIEETETLSPAPNEQTEHVRRATMKRRLIDEDKAITANKKQKSEEEKLMIAKALRRTETMVNYDPGKLTDINSKSRVSGKGRKPDSLLDKLCIACQDERGRERARCSGSGCPESWKTPRQSRNILHHAMVCLDVLLLSYQAAFYKPLVLTMDPRDTMLRAKPEELRLLLYDVVSSLKSVGGWYK